MSRSGAVSPFERMAEQYDNWYEGNPLFDIEVAALKASSLDLPRPQLEIGVGPGRFAQALGIEYGLDSAISPLQLASRRSIITVNGEGENLPFRPHTMGTVYLLFTLCFLADPRAVLSECVRVLRPNGMLVIGLIPKLSSWGQKLERMAENNHPYYRYARLRTVAETLTLLDRKGYKLIEAWSTLRQRPEQTPVPEQPFPGTGEDTGFCVLISQKGE